MEKSNDQKLKELSEREAFFKSERNFAGLIDVCNEYLELVDCAYTRERCIPLKAYCHARLGEDKVAQETFEGYGFLAMLIGQEVIYQSIAIVNLFIQKDPIEFDKFHFNTLLSWLRHAETSKLVQGIVFDYEDFLGEVELANESGVKVRNKEYTEELLEIVFVGMLRFSDQNVYYNRAENKVFMHVEGYFSDMHVQNHKAENEKLAKRIVHTDAPDIVDENIHFLLPRLRLIDYCTAILKQASVLEPILERANSKIYNGLKYHYEDLEISDISMTDHNIPEYYKVMFNSLEEVGLKESELTEILTDAQNDIARNWLEEINSDKDF
ncbi:hypothetical protein [Aureispira sp. CCB-E]|uniref:hypothetical protein n=1 Tax=Aureispira sp. CCB-E TaxID=3051121 RepID=UPI0028696BA0|nr:hypothetical protein [Aureispira sp. CCB-E]WMX16524.1 hypothetical protein QP953_09110 [Aureispira sp. CCB-E]